ncbi:MAG: uncharacterized protein JWL82_409, partial [Parcubacteria group bacterium]|nr:uncharacterized protein [Parcubacteria group bacterium]
MHLPLDKKFIPTKVAAKLSGYNSDYISRLCRERKIVGSQVGRVWFVEKASLEKFIRQQEERKREISRELSKAREVEYQAHNVTPVIVPLVKPLALPKMSGPTLREVHPLLRPGFALAVTVLVMAGSVYAAESGMVNRIEDRIIAAAIAADQGQTDVPTQAARAVYRIGDALEQGTMFVVTSAPRTYGDTMVALAATPRESAASVATAPVAQDPGMGASIARYTYSAITNFFTRVSHSLAVFFGFETPRLTILPFDAASTIYQSTGLPAPYLSPSGDGVVYQPIRNQTTNITYVQGVSETYVQQYVNSYLAQALAGLSARIGAQVLDGQGAKQQTTVASSGSANSMDGGTIVNSTITNSTFTGGAVVADSLTVNGATTLTGTTTVAGPVVFGAITGSTQCLHVDAAGVVSGTGVDCGVGGGGGLNGLRAQYSSLQTGSTQTFATSSDANLGLTITSAGDIHTFAPVWTGILSVARGGTGLGVIGANQLLIGNSAGTGYSSVATSSLGLSTTNINEGSNLFYSLGRFASALAGTTTDALAEGLINKYYTDARARSAFTATATGLSYATTTGTLSLSTGYAIPLSASSSNWNGFYDVPSTRITAGTNLSWSGNTLNGSSDSYLRALLSASSPLAYDNTSGAFSLAQASASANGYLSSTDWTTFNGKFATTSTNYYLSTKTTDSLAQGTVNLYYQDALVSTFLNSIAKSYFYSTSSADYWKGQRDFFSTTSASYFLAQNQSAAFSTSSANYYLSQNRENAFATTSANYFFSTKTTDSLAQGVSNLYYQDSLVNTYVGGSTTIAKTYTNNVFTGGNTFAFATITNATSTNLNIAGTITGGGLSACSTSSDKLLWDSATGRFTCGSDAGAGGGITSIRGQYSSSQTGAGQILATTSDTNIGLNITSAGDIHTFSPVWIGTLGINRGGTGIQSTPSYGQILLGNGSGYTLTATSSLGLESSLTFSTPLSRTGNAISIQVANDSQGGYLAATDWTTFNNKISSTSLSATGPLSYNSSTGVFSLGTVGVANGGTGWAAIQAGTLLYGNGSGALATTTSGTNGYVLALVNGTPTWQATTTLSTISGLLSLSSQVSGTLGVANGGTASTTLSGLLMGNGTSAVQTAIAGVNYLAPGSLSSTATGLTYTSGTGVFSLTAGYSIPLTASTTDWNTAYSNRITSATYPLQISSNVLSLAFGTTTANSWSQLQQFNGNASTTQLTVTGNTYLSTAGGTVAIGTTNTGGQAKLSVLKTDSDAWVSSVVLQDNANFTTNMTSNSRNLDVSIYTNVAATKTVTGTISAANLLAVRSYSTQNGVESGDQGTLAELAGMSVAFGGVNNGSSPITTLATGIHITPFFSGGSLTTAADLYLDNPSVSGATVGSYYGIYQKDSAASNYFAGNVGVGTTTPGASFGVAGASLFSGLSTFSSGINVNGETVTDLTGTGLTNVGGALTVNVSGDWTGTFDGQEGTYYLNRTNHTGTQLAATISDFSATARALFSSTAAGLTYTSGTGVFSLTAGYSIPLTASTTEWSTAYSGRITSATYPLQIASNVISIAFGTTTSNTWAGTQTFTNPIVIGSGTGTTTIASNIGITGSIIPSADNVYSLGSTAFKWKDVYIGPGSLYINGQKVLQEDVSSDIVVSADINQNLKVKTTGTGNIELNPSGSGQILLKANLSISAGKTVTNSDSSAVSFPNGAAGGNITISGNAITATNLNGGISITPAGSGGTYVTAGNFGIATTSPTNKLEVNGNTFLGGSLSVSGNTNLSGATSTSFAISNLSSVLIKANASGSLIPAVAGTDYLSSASLTASYPIQLSGNNFSLAFGTTTANSWSSLQTFNGNASTTQISAAIGFFNSILATSTTATSTFAGGLSVGPNALNVLQNGKIGIGTAAPGTTLDITGTARVSSTLSLSSIASCIGSQALQTDASGNISCGNITTGGASSGGGWTTNNVGVVGLSTTTDKVVVGASTTPYAKFTVLSGSTATTTFALFPASGQIANIFDIYNTTGALTSVINANGFLGLGTTTATQQLSVQGNALFSGNIAAAGLTATGTVTFSGLGSGLVKSTAGVLSVATAGTDYENALTFDYPLVRTVNAISLAFGTTTANVWSGSNTFNGGVTIASLNGPLQANNGVVSATSSVGVLYGGTGLTSGPSYGQILVGNASNGYTLTATSSLGLLSSAIQNLGPAGQLQNGSTVTLATSTSVVNGQTHTLTITAAGNTITYTPSVSGTLTVAGGGTGQTTFTSGQLIYGNGTNGLTSVATGTVAAGTGVSVTGGQSIIGSGLTITNTGVIAVGPAGQTTNGTALLATSTAGTDFTITGVGSTLTFNLPTASASNRGALSSADWTTFNGKQAALSFTYPLANSANIISLAFGTTTTNSWSSLQTFNGGITTSGTVTLGALTGVLHASSGIVSASNVLLGSEVSGILPTTNGGSGWSTIVANTVLLGNGTGSFATTSAGVNGQSLALVNGVPTWVATSTLATISGQLNLASQVTGTLPVGNGGTGSTTLSGILKGNGTGAIVTAIGGTDYEVPLTFSTGLNRAGNVITNTGVLSAIAGTGVSVSGATGNVTISNTGLLSLQQLGGGTAQTGALTFATSSATNNGVTLGLNITNTAGAFTFTPTLSGTLTVAGGGTGITTVADGALLFGSGSTALNTLATSTAGKVLQLDYSTGRPSWVATSTLGLITAAVQNLGPAGQLQSGPTITIASTTSTTNGLTSAMTITAAGNTITYAPSLSGTLTVAGGGTGQTSFTSGQLLYGNGTNGLTSVATGTVSAGTGVSVTGGQSVIGSGLVITNTGVTSNVAGTGISVSGATGAVTINNTGVLSLAGTANQITASAATGAITLSIPSQFNIQNASTTNLSANTLAVGGTATSSISSTGVLSLAGLTNSLLYTNGSGAVSAVTVSSPLTFTTGTLAIQVGNGSQNGYLSSGDWTTFNNKISSTSLSAGTGISYNSATGVITNTGVTSNVAGTGISVSGATGAVTVTNTGVIAVGPAGQTTNGTALFATSTTGTDFTITGSGATITFNLPTASASIRGALSSTDWSTFNGKQAALSFTYPLVNSANTISLAFGT